MPHGTALAIPPVLLRESTGCVCGWRRGALVETAFTQKACTCAFCR